MYLQGTNVSDRAVADLVTLRRLRVLDLEGSEVTYRGLSAIRDALPHRAFLHYLSP